MDQYTLKLFLHLSESLHFHKTSQACYISPSGLTRVIKRLEEETGCLLFERDNKSVALTKEGLLFREYALDTLERWKDFKENISEKQGKLQGELRLYCSVTASYSLLKPIFSTFRNKYPDVHIRLETGEAAAAVKMILNGEADIAISARPEKLPENLLFKTVIIIPLVFIIPAQDNPFRELINKESVHWQNIPMILPSHGLARKRIDSWFRNKGIRPYVYAEVLGNEAIIAMVSLGCGVGILPELVVKQSSLKSEISIINNISELKPYHVGYCIKKKKQIPAVLKAFWDLIHADAL